ncbi:prepilin-type N-terminal cleavage/methylation domain-containing protein [Virgibacillus sp. NKC19-3]|uniref:competence type IV pilus major pilin ComGC n=1 Tax=Virgibacillus saliphilus TaxID=2831674 RepID=UPI001C9A6A1F|nr:competence type IV pilus major pilin ComGC [Virgibacillus sp. NKC19-3]MBY7143382.1 prepilin-type N-terminal cleavage/methylation domain-containing protein [Virgibacillus sp. NKC19-3]
MFKNNRGFTLIEMLIVLMIISVLIILFIPNLSDRSGDVHGTGCDALISLVQSQVELYELEEGSKPGTIQALVDNEYITPDQTECSNGNTLSIDNGMSLPINMKSQRGFTFVELLLVLSILSILLLLHVPLNISGLQKHQSEQFLETFQYDVLFIQHLATTTTDDKRVYIKFHNESYEMIHGRKTMKTRYYPDGWEVDPRVMKEISFKSTGTIRQPGRIKMTSKHSTYFVVFPLGKGRGYIVEE